MGDLEVSQVRELAATVGGLARDFKLVPILAETVGNLNERVLGSTLVAKDITELAFAACEAELRSMKAIEHLIDVIGTVVQTMAPQAQPIAALRDAKQELEIAAARINKAVDHVMDRSMPVEPAL